VDESKYLLRDCDSETGTWVRVGHPGLISEGGFSGNKGSGIDLYKESRSRIYKAGEHQFTIEDHPSLVFNEAKVWLHANKLYKSASVLESLNMTG
jgi:hypothetical protein